MPRAIDAKFLPPNPSSFLSLSKTPEFHWLLSAMNNYSCLVWEEWAEPGRAVVQQPNAEAEFWIGSFLTGARSSPIDSAAFEAANRIREAYEPLVLAKTISSLKPQIVDLIRRINVWMVAGIRFVASWQRFDVNILAAWLLERGALMEELKQIWIATEGSGNVYMVTPKNTRQTTPPYPEPSVVLNSQGRLAIVNGKQKQVTAGACDVLQALLDVFPGTLKKYAIESVRASARDIITRLRQDQDWKKAISMPGKTGNGYGINPIATDGI